MMPPSPRGPLGLNPYAPPEARLGDPAGILSAEAAFFSVGFLKLALLSTFTFGLYQVYWFYRNWKCVHRLTGDELNAPIRAVFYPLTSYFLFDRIREQARKTGVLARIPAGPLAVVVFILSALWNLPDPYWLVGFLSFVPLFPIQTAINEINRQIAPDADPNRRFGAWNIVALVLGGAVLALAILGTFLDEPGAAQPPSFEND